MGAPFTILAATTEYETANLAIAEAGLSIVGATASAVAAAAAAVGIRRFGIATNRSNKQRVEADQRRAEREERRADAERDRHEESMTALKELIRRTAPPQAGPAEQRRGRAREAGRYGEFPSPAGHWCAGRIQAGVFLECR